MMYKSIKNLTFYFDLLNVILSIEDSWQMFRTKIALYGESMYNALFFNLLYNTSKLYLFQKMEVYLT